MWIHLLVALPLEIEGQRKNLHVQYLVESVPFPTVKKHSSTQIQERTKISILSMNKIQITVYGFNVLEQKLSGIENKICMASYLLVSQVYEFYMYILHCQ